LIQAPGPWSRQHKAEFSAEFTSLSVGESRSGKARLPGVHIGDGVRRPAEAPPAFRVPEAVPSEGSEHPCRETSECASARTSGQSNTHNTESREIHYLRHPWCGRSVWIHGKVVKGGRGVYRCSLEQNHEARLFEVPQWMFESGACAVRRSPRLTAQHCSI